MKRALTVVCLALLLPHTAPISAAALTFSFEDPVGDWIDIYDGPVGRAPIDLRRMKFEFDDTTGQYSITYEADPVQPFVGYFRLNTNLFNPDTSSLNYTPSFFSDTADDFNLAAPTTTIILSGLNSHLLSWHGGDRVAVSGPFPLGLPTNSPGGISAFGSGVNVPGGWCSLPCTDPFFQDRIEDAFTTIEAVPVGPVDPIGAVPVPATLWLFASAIAALAVSTKAL